MMASRMSSLRTTFPAFKLLRQKYTWNVSKCNYSIHHVVRNSFIRGAPYSRNIGASCSAQHEHNAGYSTVQDHKADLILKSPLRELNLPENPFLPHYLMENWSTYSNRPALIDSSTGSETTFSELQDQIIKLASALVRQGFCKGDIITIFSPNCPQFFTVYMAAASIGMTVSAVNPAYTSAELIHAMNLSETKLLVLSEAVMEVADAALPHCKTVQKSVIIGHGGRHQPLSSLLEDDGKLYPETIEYNSHQDVVALPYSSGTTGLPKGVMLTSHSLVANLEQIGTEELLRPSIDDVFINVLPLFHMFAGVINLFMALRHGITNVVMNKFDAVQYLENVQKYKPTHLHVVPPMMVFLAKHPVVSKYDFSSVKQFLYAAAPMSANIVTEVQEKIAPHAKFVQGYGMTELSPVSHLNPHDKPKPSAAGVTVHNTLSKIRDPESGELLPAHKEGEICVRGPQVMKGYFKNQQATADTIIDGWLHTGDIGYYDDEGYVYVTDRLKELIKYKGFQVAPAELEDLLLKHPAVLDAAVIGRPDETAGELPLAYIVTNPGQSVTEHDIQQFVKEHSAPYKELRGGVQFREEIPKAASGKILRRILRDELKQDMAK